MDTITTDRVEALEAKLDRIADQVAMIAAEVEIQARRREATSELIADMTPLAMSGLTSVSEKLVEQEVSLDDIQRLVIRVASQAGQLERLLAQLQSISELASGLTGLGSEAVTMITTRLTEMEEKGYFAFIQQAGGIVDQVVTNYSEEDVAALGDNVVLILDTVKEMTQPDIMGLLRSTATALHEQAEEVEQGTEEVPSMLGLLAQMRDPQVRLGLQRALGMLKSISGTTPEGTPTKEERN